MTGHTHFVCAHCGRQTPVRVEFRGYHVTPQEASILEKLFAAFPDPVPTEKFYINGDGTRKYTYRSLHVVMCNLRARLREQDVPLGISHGTKAGYRLLKLQGWKDVDSAA